MKSDAPTVDQLVAMLKERARSRCETDDSPAPCRDQAYVVDRPTSCSGSPASPPPPGWTSLPNGNWFREYPEYNYIVEIDPREQPVAPRCRFVRDPFGPVAQKAARDRVLAYWMQVASGDIVLNERVGCEWCAYAEAMRPRGGHNDLYTTILCNNPDVIASRSIRDRQIGEAWSRCTPSLHFKPLGTHVLAAGYFGWAPDQECIDRLERLVRPPVAKAPSSQTPAKTDTSCENRHHNFW